MKGKRGGFWGVLVLAAIAAGSIVYALRSQDLRILLGDPLVLLGIVSILVIARFGYLAIQDGKYRRMVGLLGLMFAVAALLVVHLGRTSELPEFACVYVPVLVWWWIDARRDEQRNRAESQQIKEAFRTYRSDPPAQDQDKGKGKGK